MAPLLAQLSSIDEQVSATEAKLKTLQTQLQGLDAKIVQAQDALRVLEGQKKANKDAIAAQKAVVLGLQGQLATVQSQIKAIDRARWLASPDR